MNSRFPPSRTTPGKKKTDSGSNNAVWRIPDWFADLSPAVLDRLRAYHGELLKFNLKLNLISRNTERDADEAHFADCILALRCIRSADLGTRIFDIGSGNGLPGIILGILEPAREVNLVESDSRKAEFLKHAIHILKLGNVSVMNVRFEALKSNAMQVGISRGFASVSKTCLACNKIFSVGGQFFHLKGNNWSSEIAEIPSQLISVWAPDLVGEYSLPVSQVRRAVVRTIKKQ